MALLQCTDVIMLPQLQLTNLTEAAKLTIARLFFFRTYVHQENYVHTKET